MIVIVDYGMGNVGSIVNILKKIGTKAIVSSNIADIENADKLILPGVGAFDTAMTKIHELGIKDVLDFKIKEKKTTILGICLGMQLLMQSSDEGSMAGFGWIKGNVQSFRKQISENIKVPHMGWSDVTITQQHPLVSGYTDEIRFYFVHSYFVQLADKQQQLMSCHYGLDFTASLVHENIYGVQFHPEKSHKFGMLLLNNFAKL